MEREKISLGLQGIDEEFILNAKNKKKHWSRTTMGKVALVACLPLLCAAGIVTGVFVDVVEVFTPLFGGTNPQTEIIQEIGRPIGASCTSNGVTITVDAIIGDENTAKVVYTFANEDGTPLELPVIPEPEEVDGIIIRYDFGTEFSRAYNGEEVLFGTKVKSANSVHSWYEFVDVNPDDGTFQLIETFSSDDMPMGKKVTASFREIGMNVTNYNPLVDYDERITTDFVPFLQGEWDIEYRFDYGKSNITLAKNEVFTHEDREVKVDSMSISPFSLSLEYNFIKFSSESEDLLQGIDDFTEEDWNHYHELGSQEAKKEMEFVLSIPIYLIKTDGTKVELMGTTGNTTSSTKDSVQSKVQIIFDEIIPLEDIATVTFGEITVQVS